MSFSLKVKISKEVKDFRHFSITTRSHDDSQYYGNFKADTEYNIMYSTVISNQN